MVVMYDLIKKRDKIILELLEKSNNSYVSKSLNINRKTVSSRESIENGNESRRYCSSSRKFIRKSDTDKK